MTAETARRRPAALGRGLSALLGEIQRPVEEDQSGRPSTEVAPVDMLAPHPDQPRRRFDDAALDELASSIKARGILQPIVVRRLGEGYQIIAGERRWRASQRAGLSEVPIIIKDFDDAETLEVALVENIQREDLTAIEEAEAYKRLIDQFGHTQEALGRLVGKSRSHVANLLRLIDLPEEVRDAVADGRLSMGHARALVTAENPAEVARAVLARRLSVRETERFTQAERTRRTRAPLETKSARMPSEDVAVLERQIGEILGLSVRLQDNGRGGGALQITFASYDQLDMLCQRLSGEGI